MATKYNKNDMIMGYQIGIKYTGLFAGKILRSIPAIRLFGTASYEIELTEELQKNGLTKIWVDEEFSSPFNKEMYEEALDHWKKFHEHIELSKREIKNLRTIFSKSEEEKNLKPLKTSANLKYLYL